MAMNRQQRALLTAVLVAVIAAAVLAWLVNR